MTDPKPPVFSYDEIQYPSVPKAETHPDRLATLAVLMGMTPPPVRRCRVLELGCSDGGNLIPMALSLPEGRFVGVDLGRKQIESAREIAEALGLTNITFRHMSITEVDESIGQFDYIIAYGVFSWVGREVQEKILALCGQLLTPNGVALISYNTYPGWHVRRMLREMMLYHTRRAADRYESAEQARAFLDFLYESAQALSGRQMSTIDMNTYGHILKREQEALGKRPDSYLVHDLLEEENHPVYFTEFLERAARYGLQYLAEADYFSMHLSNFPPVVAQGIAKYAHGVAETEQYMDFVRNRTFRQTLLCREGIPLDREAALDRVRSFHVTSLAQPMSEKLDLDTEAPEKFRGHTGVMITIHTPLAKAAMLLLSETWPASVPFSELLARAHYRQDPDWIPVESAEQAERDAAAMADMLLKFFKVDLVEFHVEPVPCVAKVSERPVASPLARLQARRHPVVTNMRHEHVSLDSDLLRHLIPLMDGSRTLDDLLDEMLKLVADGTLVVHPKEGEPAGDVAEVMAKAIQRDLFWLCKGALLVA